MSFTAVPPSMTRSSFAEVSSNTTLDGSNEFVYTDTSSADVTITLPGTTNNNGQTFSIAKSTSDFNKIVISPDGTDTVDGGSSINVHSFTESVDLICDEENDNWVVLRRNVRPYDGSFSPTVSGLFYSGGDFKYIRLWSVCLVRFSYNYSSSTGTEFQFGTPGGQAVATNPSAIAACGAMDFSATDDHPYIFTRTGGDAFLNATTSDGSGDYTTPINGSGLPSANGSMIGFFQLQNWLD